MRSGEPIPTDAVTVLATGPDFVVAGQDVRSFDRKIEDLILHAEKKIQIAAYRFDRDFERYLNLLEERAAAGVEVVIICDALNRNDEAIRLPISQLSARISVLQYCDHRRSEELLHAKVMVVDSEHAVVGSANFGFGGLVRNLELGVYIRGRTPWQLARMLDELAAVCTYGRNT